MEFGIAVLSVKFKSRVRILSRYLCGKLTRIFYNDVPMEFGIAVFYVKFKSRINIFQCSNIPTDHCNSNLKIIICV